MISMTKIHGLGNDFLLIDATAGTVCDYVALAPKLCDRHTGVGADGILIAEKSDIATIRMRLINADGSEAEMCGNGIRAFSKYVYERGLVREQAFEVETLAGIMKPSLILEGSNVVAIRVDMGEPGLECADVPVLLEGVDSRCVDKPLFIRENAFRFTSIRMGVPHTMVCVKDAATFPVTTFGPKIETNEMFPEKTNVNFVTVVDRENVIQRTWERGAGATLACGTGASATAVSCHLAGYTGKKVNVHLERGTLQIEWADDNHVYMTGPATVLFDCTIDESLL